MVRRRWIAALVLLAPALAALLSATEARAQPDLPPPPPPPMGPPEEAPSPPPTDPPHAAGHRGTAPAAPAARRAREPHATAVAPIEPPSPPSFTEPHSIAVTLSPLGLPWGRLSASAEMLVARHHALTASPNVLIAPADRGGAHALLSEGFGFASRGSASVGLELGYHYWLYDARSLHGPFFGPSILFGGTTQANVGDSSHLQGYWGVTIDAGFQEVLSSGFTFGGGVGFGLMRMADFTGAFPRALAGLGWSF